jgi:phosphopantetheinyl transferase
MPATPAELRADVQASDGQPVGPARAFPGSPQRETDRGNIKDRVGAIGPVPPDRAGPVFVRSSKLGRGEGGGVAQERLRPTCVPGQELPARSGFHSPKFAEYLGSCREHLAKLFLADEREGYLFLGPRAHDSARAEVLIDWYCHDCERAEYESLGATVRDDYLAGHVAAKDAVRVWCRRHDLGQILPVEVVIGHDEGGRPLVAAPDDLDLRISIAHSHGHAVAAVRCGREVGADLELIEPRGRRFADLVLTRAEKDLRPYLGDDAWLTRLWTAKEAAAKARGTGLLGRPKDFEVDEIEGDRLRIDGRWITTTTESTREGEFIVGVTD